jgi:hypothetical protein
MQFESETGGLSWELLTLINVREGWQGSARYQRMSPGCHGLGQRRDADSMERVGIRDEILAGSLK